MNPYSCTGIMKILSSISSSFLSEIPRSVIYIYSQRRCVICGKELLQFEKQLCLNCLADMPVTYYWTMRDNPANMLFWGRAEIERSFPLFFFRDEYKKCVYDIKYKGDTKTGTYLGRVLGKRIIEGCRITGYTGNGNLTIFDAIVPVPLHWKKKLKRGFNQSEIIAIGISKSLKIKVLHSLLKRRNFTRTQTQKDKMARWRNVENAFEVTEAKGFIKGMGRRKIERICKSGRPVEIVLVDDVLTTGATLEACAALLHKSINCRICVATLAVVE